MKVSRTGSLNSSAVRRTGRATAGGSSAFASHIPASDAASDSQPVAGARSLTGVDALLSVQEMGDVFERERQARQRAEDILDRLDDLRHGLLAGLLSRHQVENLARLVRLRRSEVKDQRLLEILDQIELRAEIELAKYSTLD